MRARARLVDVDVLPVDVAGAAQREVERAGGDGRVALAVDQDEAAERAIVAHRARTRSAGRGAGCSSATSLRSRCLAASVLLRVDVDLVLDLGDRRADRARAELQPVRAPRQQRLFAHPQQVRGELVGDLRRIARGGDDVAAADVDLVGQRQRDGLAGDRDCEVAIGGRRRARPSNVAPTAARPPRRPARTRPAATVPAKPRKSVWIAASALTHCTGRRKPPSRLRALDLHRLQVLEQRRAAIPRHRAPSAAACCRPSAPTAGCR